MTATPHQLILDLAQRPALGAEDFLISGSNRAAADIVDLWPHWPHASLPSRRSKGEAAAISLTMIDRVIT